MKQTLIMLSLCALLVGCTNMKNWGPPETRNYPVNGTFTGLDVSGPFEVMVGDMKGDVAVTVGERAHDKVIVEVRNGKLYIGFKPHTHYNGTATAVIPQAVLRDLDLSGAAKFSGGLNGEDVEMDLSGASKFEGSVTAAKFSVDLSGASDAYIFGSCETNMKIDLSGASTLEASALNTDAVSGDMSGASKAEVTCCSSLKVDLSGASNLIYGTLSDECHPVVNCPCSGGSTVSPRP